MGIYTEQRQSYIRQSMVWDRQASLDGNSDPTAAPPGFAAHGRSFSSVSKSSNLRNEVKVAGDHDEDDELVGDTSYSSQISPQLSGKRGGDGYVDAGLYASGSPTKQHGYQNSMNSTYSAHQHANSRSNHNRHTMDITNNSSMPNRRGTADTRTPERTSSPAITPAELGQIAYRLSKYTKVSPVFCVSPSMFCSHILDHVSEK